MSHTSIDDRTHASRAWPQAAARPTGTRTSSASCSDWYCSRPTSSPGVASARRPVSPPWRQSRDGFAGARRRPMRCTRNTSTTARRSRRGRCSCLIGRLRRRTGVRHPGASGAVDVERGPHVSESRRLALAFVGGFIAAYGAKIAKGCTSGQALTGGSILKSAASCSWFRCLRRPTGWRTRTKGMAVMFPCLVDGFHARCRSRPRLVLGVGFGFCLERADSAAHAS